MTNVSTATATPQVNNNAVQVERDVIVDKGRVSVKMSAMRATAEEQGQGFFGRTYDRTTNFVAGMIPNLGFGAPKALSQKQIDQVIGALVIQSQSSALPAEPDRIVDTTAGVRAILMGLVDEKAGNQAHIEMLLADVSELVYTRVSDIVAAARGLNNAPYSAADQVVILDPKEALLDRIEMAYGAYVDMRGSQINLEGAARQHHDELFKNVTRQSWLPALDLSQAGLEEMFADVYTHVFEQVKESVVVPVGDAAASEVTSAGPAAVEPPPAPRAELYRATKTGELIQRLQRHLLDRYLSTHKQGAKLDMASEVVSKYMEALLNEKKINTADSHRMVAAKVVNDIFHQADNVDFDQVAQ